MTNDDSRSRHQRTLELFCRGVDVGMFDEELHIDPKRFPDPETLEYARRQAALVIIEGELDKRNAEFRLRKNRGGF